MSNLIDVHSLHGMLGDDRLRLADTRFDLRDPDKGRQAYHSGHLPGAVFFDLDHDLSVPNPPGTKGGRHPLPSPHDLAAKLGERGIGNEHIVVVYDDSTAAFAGRLWWLFRFLGHDDVKVLDGGVNAWLEAGYPLQRTLPVHPPTTFTPRVRAEMAVDADYVKRRLDDPGVALIDARTIERYRGDSEPLDIKAGHIPGARPKPLQQNLAGGRFRSPDALRQQYEDVAGAREVIAYCGSGVSAAHSLIALEEAGIKGAKLYVGSWSDWSSDPSNPVAAGDDSSSA